MNESEIIRKIEKKSVSYAKDLKLISQYIDSDPETSISKARKLLESMVSEYAEYFPEGIGNLNDQIRELSKIVPSHVETQMHFIRKLGNTATHSDEKLDSALARQNFEMLLSIICWNYKINPEEHKGESEIDGSNSSDKPEASNSISEDTEGTVKVRYFIADEIYRTWPKIAVLTQDGTLYSEYLAWMKPVVFKRSGFDIRTFESKDFSFGEDEHGGAYQPIREVDFQEAVSLALKRQDNWVQRYLHDLGITDS